MKISKPPRLSQRANSQQQQLDVNDYFWLAKLESASLLPEFAQITNDP